MTLNVNKCKLVLISHSSTDLPSYQLNRVPLESVRSYKYLGIHITSDLSSKAHTDFIASKANRMLGYLKHHFYSDPTTTKLLFLQIYRSFTTRVCLFNMGF